MANPDIGRNVTTLGDLFDEFQELTQKIQVQVGSLLDRDTNHVAQLVEVLLGIIKLYEEPPNIYTRSMFDEQINRAKTLIDKVSDP